MENLLHRTKVQTLRCSAMMLVLVILNMLTNTIIVLPMVLLTDNDFDPMKVGSSVIYTAITSITFIFIIPFFHAGIYGLTFLKMNLQKTAFNRFSYLAISNYWTFLRIGIAIGLIYILYFAFSPRLLALAIPSADYFMAINSYSAAILSLLISLFFVFAYPLAIVGFFSKQNLKPIRSSFARVVKDFGKIKFIIALLVLDCAIRILSKSILPDVVTPYRTIFLPLITTPITFVVMIYSYLLITDHFYSNLRIDFSKT